MSITKLMKNFISKGSLSEDTILELESNGFKKLSNDSRLYRENYIQYVWEGFRNNNEIHIKVDITRQRLVIETYDGILSPGIGQIPHKVELAYINDADFHDKMEEVLK